MIKKQMFYNDFSSTYNETAMVISTAPEEAQMQNCEAFPIF